MIIYPRGTVLSLSASLVFPMTVVVGKVNSKRSNLNGCISMQKQKQNKINKKQQNKNKEMPNFTTGATCEAGTAYSF